MEPSGLISPTNAIAQVGNYNLIKTIGKGQFGSVKLAVHSLTGEKVAIKIISKTRLDQKTLRMVYREVSIMKLLNHPNIIRLYEIIETASHLFLVMEYASGGEVMDFIVAHGKLKERDARRFFRQVVAAIDYCHSVHVIHRDLKAENLLLDEKFHIRLIDFGLSNRWTPGEYLNTFCGSPTYTAPELIKRQKYEGPEIDVWSMGVLLYVLVCGSLPFDGSSFQELFTKIISGDYTVPDDISSECRDLIGRMLVVDPKQRATVDQIRTHKWILDDDGMPVPKAVPINFPMPTSVDDIDFEVVGELEQLGFEREHTIRAILEQSYDDAAATYFLLYGKKKKEEELRQQRRQLQQQQFLAATSRVIPVSANNKPDAVQQPVAGSTGSGARQTTSQQPPSGTRAPAPTTAQGESRTGKSSRPTAAGIARHRRHHTLGTPGEFNLDQPQTPEPVVPAPYPTSLPKSIPSTGLATSNSLPVPATTTSPSSTPGSSPQPSPPYYGSPNTLLPTIPENSSTPSSGKSTQRRSAPRKPPDSSSSSPSHHVVVKDGKSSISKSPTGAPSLGVTRASSGEKMDIPPLSLKDAKNGSTSGLTPATEALVAALPDRQGGLEDRAPSAPAITVTQSSSSSTKRKSHKREHSTGSSSTSSSGGVHRRHRSVDNEYDRKKAVTGGSASANTTPTKPPKDKDKEKEGAGGDSETHSKKSFLKTPKEKDSISERRSSSSAAESVSMVVTYEKPPVPEPHHNAPSLPFINVKRVVRPKAKVPPRKATTLRVGKEAKQQQQQQQHQQQQQQQQQERQARQEQMAELDDWHTMNLDGTVESAPSTDEYSSRDRLIAGKAVSAGNSPNAHAGAAAASSSSSFIDSFKSKLGGLLQFKKPEPRQARFPLNEQSTSHKPPEVILEQIKNVLNQLDIPFMATSPFCLKCQATNIGFEVEICRLPFLYLNGVRFRRIYGDAWEYTNTCKKILTMLDLKNRY